MSYLKGARSARSHTSQRQPIPGRQDEQVKNDAGGFVFELDTLAQLRRFLILGAEGGTYYVSQEKLVTRNVAMVARALGEHGTAAVDVIVAVSVEGRAIKEDTVLFALATAATYDSSLSSPIREYAMRQLPLVARTGYQLFTFLGFLGDLLPGVPGSHWSLFIRKGVAAWYERGDVDALAFQMVKYRQRDGWSHKRAIQLAHPKPPSSEHESLYQWALGKNPLIVHEYVEGFQYAQIAEKPSQTAALIEQRAWLPREALRTEHTRDVGVWRALLKQGMPAGAMLRNLGRMTSYGVLTPMGEYTSLVAAKLTDPDTLRRARVHPVAVLKALLTYKAGQGQRMRWQPVQRIVDALDEAFYLAFDSVVPSGKRMLLAVDVSGSMVHHRIGGFEGLNARMGAAAMALVTAASERDHLIVAFSTRKPVMQHNRLQPDVYYQDGQADWTMTPFDIGPRMRLDAVAQAMHDVPAGGTDCSLPMRWAHEQGIDADVFVIYTDMETWAGPVHPVQALRDYRRSRVRDARLVVVGMAATPFTLADPADSGTLDVVGFDTRTPDLISAFARGEV